MSEKKEPEFYCQVCYHKFPKSQLSLRSYCPGCEENWQRADRIFYPDRNKPKPKVPLKLNILAWIHNRWFKSDK